MIPKYSRISLAAANLKKNPNTINAKTLRRYNAAASSPNLPFTSDIKKASMWSHFWQLFSRNLYIWRLLSEIYCNLNLHYDSAASDQRRPPATRQPPDPLREQDLLQFTIRQRRSRPAATTGDNATARPSKGARYTAIHNKTAPQPTSGDHRRPPATTQPPEPLRERDLLQCTTSGDHATARPSKGARSDQRGPPATTEPPAPLRERDRLQFTIRQRRSRPAATNGDHRRPHNRQPL